MYLLWFIVANIHWIHHLQEYERIGIYIGIYCILCERIHKRALYICKYNHYIYIQTQDSICRTHKTKQFMKSKTEETSGLVPMSLITSALHSLPPSCKAPYFLCLHKSVTHPQTFGTDWIAFCRSRFYLTVAKVPLFHCYDILKLAQLVLLLGHCLGSFMTHDTL